MHQDKCEAETRSTATEPDITLYNYDYADLYWSKNNIIHLGNGANTGGNTLTNFDLTSTSGFTDCTGFGDPSGDPATSGARNEDPTLMSLPNNALETLTFIDPRPEPGTSNPAFNNLDDIPDDGFFDQVTFKGAFGTDLWLAGWSMLSERKLIPDNVMPDEILKGDITADKTLDASKTYFMTEQVFVKNGAELTIPAGTTIKSFRADPKRAAPTLVIEQGAKITAKGTASEPITFTSALPASQLPLIGTWGGVILLGKAPIAGSVAGSTDSIEGLPTGDGIYGGNAADDNSGTMQYVRIWYGGSEISTDNEINGLTLGGVGSGTTLDHIEIAYNYDDGIEFFGGTANVKYLSVLFCGDDGIDTDQGYRGKIQYAVVATGKDGHHTLEMDSKENTANDATTILSCTTASHRW